MTVVAGHPTLTIDPPYDWPEYRSTAIRAPTEPLVLLDARLLDAGGPVFGEGSVGPGDADLTRQHDGAPLGERIAVGGRLLDSAGRPVAGQLVEVWQCNAAGRYRHAADQHPAPLDPNFTGAGRCLTGPDGTFRFLTIKPGAYPWGNHPNAWRPAHLQLESALLVAELHRHPLRRPIDTLGGDLTASALVPRGQQTGRSQETSDVVGSERWSVAPGHGAQARSRIVSPCRTLPHPPRRPPPPPSTT